MPFAEEHDEAEVGCGCEPGWWREGERVRYSWRLWAGVPNREEGVVRVKVVFHAEFRRAAGVKEVELEVPGPATVRDALAIIAERVPALNAVINHAISQDDLGSHMVISINGQIASPNTSVQPGDELRLLPPISGG